MLKKQREEILKPPEPVPAVPVILPINNPAQKEPPISGSDPAAQPVGPAALPNPPPPIEKEPAPIVSGKGKGNNTGKGVSNKKQREAHDKIMNKSKGYGTIKEQPIEVIAMNTPPRAAKGADRKSRERRAV